MVVIFVVIRSTKIPKGFSHVFYHALSRLNLFNWFFEARRLPKYYQNLYNLVQPSNSGEITVNHDMSAYLL